MITSNVVPQARLLGSRELYELLFRRIFVAGESVLREDVRSFCLASLYGSGSQLDGALDLLLNIGVLKASSNYLKADAEFLRYAQESGIGLAVSDRLIDRLLVEDEIESVFPVGSLSWGEQQDELIVHVSQIPMSSLPVIKLFRDLDTIQESETAAVILKVLPPFSAKLKTASAAGLRRKISRKVLSPEELERIQSAQSKQGMKAEEYVLAFELKRLHGHPQVQLVRRVSEIDTGAGFDIESFEGLRSFFPDRFIEVKSYQGSPRFFWSQGEIAAATELGENYCLYLVDMEQLQSPDYSPVVIRNPVTELFSDNSNWTATPVSYEFITKQHQARC